jgi:glutamate synthase (NADPH/NADH) small chain
MPEICSRVCDQSRQCEKHCIRAKNGESVAIGLLERYVCDNVVENIKNAAVLDSFSKSVAIIGSGPAGLACAEELIKGGYSVTIFESENDFGGLLTYGIPNYRLPYNLVENKINQLKNSGVIFKNNTKFGVDLTVEDLKYAGFAVIFIAIGTPKAKYMGIPGENSEVIITSNDFLKNVSIQSKNIKNDVKSIIYGRVGVVGGGNSAIDAARSALRINGATSVEIIYRRTRNSMPAAIVEIEDAINEGVILNDLTLPTEIICENNQLKAVKCVKMCETEVGADGRKSVKPVKGSEFIKELDSLIYAIGNDTDDLIANIDHIKLNKWKNIEVDENGKACDSPLIFAAGDVVSGPSTVVKAMVGGRKAAHQIDKILKNI